MPVILPLTPTPSPPLVRAYPRCASQALLSAVDRDALSGWGAVVQIITLEGVTTKRLKARMD